MEFYYKVVPWHAVQALFGILEESLSDKMKDGLHELRERIYGQAFTIPLPVGKEDPIVLSEAEKHLRDQIKSCEGEED